MEDKMIYAPILIDTLCRDKHFIEGIESLKRNTWAMYTDVYIALDYPKEEKHRNGYEKICEYLESDNFSEFKSFNVIKRDVNYGVGKNMAALLDDVMKSYDRWIRAEDDIVFAPVFLEYMDKCLMQFEQNDDVIAINGYSYPLKYCSSNEATVIKQSATFSTWGTGWWKSKYLKIREKLNAGYLFNEFNIVEREGKLKSLIGCRYYDYVEYALTRRNEKYFSSMSDMAIGIYMNLIGSVTITPIISKTRNNGFDGSGINCQKISNYSNKHSLSYDYKRQKIDDAQVFNLVIDSETREVENRKIIDDFLYVPYKQKIRVWILFIIYKICGKNTCLKLYSCLRKILKK